MKLLASYSMRTRFLLVNATNIKDAIPDIFEQKVGYVSNFVIKLQFRESLKSSYILEWNVLYALWEEVEKIWQPWKTGIISKSETSDWSSSLVVIPKAPFDSESTVNDHLVNTNYPIKKIEEVLHSFEIQNTYAI